MKWNKKHIVLSILLPIQMLLIELASKNPEFIETYYSNGIYLYLSKFLRIVLGWLPFSVGDLLMILGLFVLIRFLYRLIRTNFKNLIPKIIHITAVLSIIYFCFYLLWGLNYYREPLVNTLNFKNQPYSTDQLHKVTETILIHLNESHSKLTKNDTLKIQIPHSQDEMYKIALNGYKNLSYDFPQFLYKNPSIKSSLISSLQTYNKTSGYLNPFTGEAQVNDKIPKTSFPTTTCHEMAHQIGYAAENEANFIGFLAANYNENLYFKYASYRMAFGYCISELRKRDENLSRKLWVNVNKGIVRDYKESYEFWQNYKNPIEPIIKKGYSAYLKANKQEKGIESYNYVVNLLIYYFEAKKN